MDTLDFNALIAKLPEIAQAVNAFSSEDLQRRAFDLLTRTLGIDDDEPVVRTPSQKEKPEEGVPKRARAARRRANNGDSRGSQPKFLSDLNLRPSGKPGLQDFVAEKKPKDNQEYYAVIGYYITQRLGEPTFNRDHIYTAFKVLGQKVPTDIDGGLRKTSERKGWINTVDTNKCTMTVAGENFVEHDLPHKSKK